MKIRIKSITTTSIVITVFISLLLLSKSSVVSYVYHNRFLSETPMETKKKGFTLSKRVNFRFTMKDADFLNSFGNTISTRCDNWHPVELLIDNQNFPVEIRRFKNYFKYLKLENVNRSISLRFHRKKYHERIRRFDMFQSNTIDVMEQELIYKMAEKLNLCIPHTDFVGIHVHDSYNGMSLFKQSFDHVFLEQNRFPNSI
ncbi:MAG: hypothetical protein GY757_21695, partial [bacterium]|nr:hypothetical protein [bacterium]